MERAVDIAALLAVDTLAVAASRANYSLRSMIVTGEELSDRKKQWLGGMGRAAEGIQRLVEYLTHSQANRLSGEEDDAGEFVILEDEQRLHELLEEFVECGPVFVKASEGHIAASNAEDKGQLDKAAKALDDVLELCEAIRARELVD